MNVTIEVPDSYTGTIIGDLNKRRGAIMGMEPVDDNQIITAQVPLAEMLRYALDLRSMSQGLGSYTMEMDRYDPVPDNISQKIIAQHQK